LTKQYSILLGDNPFFGVSHLSQEIARQKAAKSQNFNNILDVMNSSFNMGINKMVVSTHPQLNDLIQHIKNNSQLIDKFEFYPILPYAQGYVSKVNEMGMINALKDILNSASFQNKIGILAKGGLGVLRKDFFKLFKVLIDIELLKLQNSKINTVFLHDVLTDLALSLGMKKVFQTFQEHIHEKHKLKSGLVTKNLPLLISKLNEWELKFPKIMTSFNPIGFQMNPSRNDCEKAILDYDGEIIAMSVLAGGFLKLQDAYEYLSKIPQITSLVIGVSSTDHAKSTFSLFINKN